MSPTTTEQAQLRAMVATTVSDVMHPTIVSCSKSASAATVARLMADARVHCIPVVSPGQDGSGAPRIWGIISDLDILAAATRPDPPATAADLAAEAVVSVRPSMSLSDAAQAMVKHHAHHVIVVDPEQHLPVGILSALDLAEVLANDLPR